MLVVDDDRFVAELAADMVREIGYEPHVVHSAVDALSALGHLDNVVLVFSDVVMPGEMNGVELAGHLRKSRPELPVLLTTGYSHVIADARPKFPLVTKPYDLDRLSSVIEQLLSS